MADNYLISAIHYMLNVKVAYVCIIAKTPLIAVPRQQARRALNNGFFQSRHTTSLFWISITSNYDDTAQQCDFTAVQKFRN
jgi:hypothetical protein